MLFEVSDTAISNVWGTVLRALTIVLSVGATRWYVQRQQQVPAAASALA